MGGKNPYYDEPEYTLPDRPYTVTFWDAGHSTTVTVDPSKIPYGDDGLPGSLLDIALAHRVLINHACGGVCACSTCHVYVREGMKSCNPAQDSEEEQLDNAPHILMGKSRLACQCIPDGSQDLVVEVPGWNRNLANEGVPL
ncbi:2Fe-2S iron-sulfur cluster-binding protein [Anthocerotibacter panamensis]|uniref:2Fe-2S iron-sulfur cluster-binding protein n=1 Tax=Anthocerotibacter panamensis TaxID=2857077 RepID=UPI001C40764C|nr:2Fe-2S iron-sulfur cluster-binding protein [Anthocerotibacter panamensis]